MGYWPLDKGNYTKMCIQGIDSITFSYKGINTEGPKLKGVSNFKLKIEKETKCKT